MGLLDRSAMCPTNSHSQHDKEGEEPGRCIGPYSVLALLGRGGMGAVYHVRHPETGAEYALKLLNPKSAQAKALRVSARFQREVELLARVDAHPALVRIHSSGEAEGCAYCVMELVTGEPLDKRLEGGPMMQDEAVQLAIELAGGLEHIHDMGVVHRDLKPANVILDEQGHARLVDFGLADSSASETLTETAQAVGTPLYMSPEQIRVSISDDPLDNIGPWSDVYGLGMVLYCALTAKRPYSAPDQLSLMKRILNEPPPPPSHWNPSISSNLDSVVLKALERSPADRYRSARELSLDLTRYLDGTLQHVDTKGWLTRAGPISRPLTQALAYLPPWASVLATVSLLVALTAATLLFRSQAQTRQLLANSQAKAQVSSKISKSLNLMSTGAPVVVSDIDALLAEADRIGLAKQSDVRLLATLVESFKDNHGWVEDVDLRSPPWLGNETLIADVLCRSGGAAGLNVLLQRQPRVIRRGRVAESVATAMSQGQLPVSWDLVMDLAAELKRHDDHDSRELHWQIMELGLGELLVRDPIDHQAVLSGLDELAGFHSRPVEALQLSTSATKGIGELTLAALDSKAQTFTLRQTEQLVAVALMQIPKEQPILREVVEGVGSTIADSIFKVGAVGEEGMTPVGDPSRAAKDLIFQLTLALLRSERVFLRIKNLLTIAPPSKEVEQRAHDELSRGPVAFRPSDITTLFLILLQRGPDGRSNPDKQVRALLGTVEWQWLLEAILARERDRADVPAWALAETSTVLRHCLGITSTPLWPHQLNEVQDMLRRVLGEDSRDPLPQTISWLCNRAMDRLERSNRGIKPPLAIVATCAGWFAMRESGEPLERFQAMLNKLQDFHNARAASAPLNLDLGSLGPENRNELENAGINAVNRILEGDTASDVPCAKGLQISAITDVLDELFSDSAIGDELKALHWIHHGRASLGISSLERQRHGRGPTKYRMRILQMGIQKLLNANRLDDARVILRWSISKISSDRAGDYVRRATTLQQLGEIDLAEQDLQRADALNRR